MEKGCGSGLFDELQNEKDLEFKEMRDQLLSDMQARANQQSQPEMKGKGQMDDHSQVDSSEQSKIALELVNGSKSDSTYSVVKIAECNSELELYSLEEDGQILYATFRDECNYYYAAQVKKSKKLKKAMKKNHINIIDSVATINNNGKVSLSKFENGIVHALEIVKWIEELPNSHIGDNETDHYTVTVSVCVSEE